MLYIAFVIALIAAFLLGYSYRGLVKRVVEVEKAVAKKIDKPVEVEESPSEIIDPYDEIAEAQYQMKKEQERLNGPR